MQKMTLKKQIQTAARALCAAVWGAGFGALLGFYSYAGAVFYDLFSGVNCAVLFACVFALAVIFAALWPAE